MQTWRHLPKQEFQRVNDNSTCTVIDLLRHGEVEGGSKYRGHQDDPLSEAGWQQLQQVTKENQGWQHIVTSPLQRCSSFASELAVSFNLPLVQDNAFKEIYFGAWEGKSADELLKSEPDKIKQYWADPVNYTPPQAENFSDFENRIMNAWGNLFSLYEGKHILLLSHAGVIRVILCHILDMPLTQLFRLDIALASMSRIEINKIDNKIWPRLIFHGNTFSS